MILTSTMLIAVPDSACVIERLDLRELMARGLKIEERMAKGVGIEDEQRRYHTLCDRMEYLANLICTSRLVEAADLGLEYFDLLLGLQSKYPEETKKARLMSNFCPANLVSSQLDQFLKLMKMAGLSERKEVKIKAAFYERASQNRWHILEIQEPTVLGDTDNSGSESGLLDQFLAMPISDDITAQNQSSATKGLRIQINKVIDDLAKNIPAAVNFSDIPHSAITDILYEFAYKSGKPMYLPVVYGDGSKARPLPIHCLKPKAETVKQAMSQTPSLAVGMMSGRHHELDSKVKIYFYRNQEISIGRTAAESDEVAYLEAKKTFERLRKEGIYRIAFHQTGFQPAVVGFFRALIEEIVSWKNSAPILEVTPQFYFEGGVRPGQPWI